MDKTMKDKWKERFSVFIKGWVGSFLIALLLATSVKSAIADWYIVPTASMKPTIVEGDRIFVNKLAYDLKLPYTMRHIATWDAPRRGDIVAFYSPADGIRLVKRVVGLPGDTIFMKDNQLYINGSAVKYESIPDSGPAEQDPLRHVFMEDLTGRRHPVMISPFQPSPRSFDAIRVPEGQFFMMGDNRDNSADSRYFGFVERSLIIGKATAVVASLDINNCYQPRWERFFTGLP